MTPKYAGDKDPRWHRGQLCYPGTTEGYPVRIPEGTAPAPIRDRDYRNIPVEYDVKAKAFNTWDEASFVDYQEVIDRIANGPFILIQRTKPEYDSEKQGWRMYVEWAQPYGRISSGPPGAIF